MIKQSTTKSFLHTQDNWKQQKDVVTHNDVIDAYLEGKVAGRNEVNKAMVKLFETNLNKAQETSEELYKAIIEMGFNINSIHLKADNLTSFMVLAITDLDDYVNERFLEAISFSRKLRQKSTEDDFNIDFLFTYKAKTLNERCLNSDGYFLKYYGNK